MTQPYGTPLGLDDPSAVENELQVIPNPATEDAFVQFPSSGSTMVDLTIIDATGRVVKHLFQGRPVGGLQRIVLPTAELSAGIYMIRSVQGDKISMIRFTVDHIH